MFSRPLPSIDHCLFRPKKYLPLLFSTSAFEMRGPTYSTIFVPLGIGLVANNPKPVAARFTAYGVSPVGMRRKVAKRIFRDVRESSHSCPTLGFCARRIREIQ